MAEADIQHLIESLQGLQPTDGPGPGGLGVDELRPVDIARALADIDETGKALIVSLLSDEKAADVLVETDGHSLTVLLEQMSPERIVRLLDAMDPDDAADIIGHAPEELRGTLLASLEVEQQRVVRALHEHAPDSAGGVMTSEVVSVGSNETIGSALQKVGAAEQAEAVHNVYVVDPAGTLVGVLSLQDLLGADEHVNVGQVMNPDVISVPVDADREDAAQLVDRYDLASLAVVDSARRLAGVITLDDVIDVLGEEASEDMLRLAGTSVLHPTTEPILRRLRARAPWLGITLVGTFAASLLIEEFETNFVAASAGGPSLFNVLLYFVPLIAGLAGNVGTQSSTIMVRGFATGEVDPRRPMRVLRGEVTLALLTGLIAGVLVGVAASVFFDVVGLGWIVGLALPASILTAGLFGTLIPFLCEAVNVDPAYAGGPFLLTLNDLAAISIYFTVALTLRDVFLV